MVVGFRELVHAREINQSNTSGLMRARELHHGCRV